MKKVIGLLLTLVMCLSTIAIAEDIDQAFYEYPEVGMTASVPMDFKDLKGIGMPYIPAQMNLPSGPCAAQVGKTLSIETGGLEGNPIVGAKPEAYESALQGLLDGKTVEPAEGDAATPAYTVAVVDQNGDPVPEAAVGFCLDSGCVPVETDENGVATYNGAPDRYHIKVVDAPDAYDYPDDTDVYIGPEAGSATLTITKE